MIERNTTIPAVHVFMFRDGQVLLQRRCNTGFGDGLYSVPAGHIEYDEDAVGAAVRELAEETALCVAPERVDVRHTMYRRDLNQEKHDRINFFVTLYEWAGEPRIAEPDKCDDLRWFPLDALPENTLDYIRFALGEVLAGRTYSYWPDSSVSRAVC